MATTALIIGVAGQDGSYLAEHLLALGYRVCGAVRHGSARERLWRVEHLLPPAAPALALYAADVTDVTSLCRLLHETRPDEVYNLAAMSFVPTSWGQPLLAADVIGLGTLRLLEAVRMVCPRARVYQASSSEMFGSSVDADGCQREGTPFRPRSPYGCAKAFAHHCAVNYRDSYGMHVCCGILFNHESPRRNQEFVTRKISDGVARIKRGQARTLALGNLEARRDWGFAGDHVKAMRLMLQGDEPGDYVVGTGEAHGVREFAAAAFACAGLDWREHVVCDPGLVRPAEVDVLRADAGKARRELGWRPAVDFKGLVEMMVAADLERLG